MHNFEPDPMLYELVEIDEIEDIGWCNCYDITCCDMTCEDEMACDDTASNHTFILGNGVVSHNSALGGLMPVLGRENMGYYTLKGKPLNAYSQSHKKFTENKELSGLYQVLTNGVDMEELPEGDFYQIGDIIANESDEIVQNGKWVKVSEITERTKLDEIDRTKYRNQKNVRRIREAKGGFEKIVFATDQDLDGIHIRGLLAGFIEEYLPAMKDRVGMLQTPVIAVTNGEKVQRWVYDLTEKIEVKRGERVDYKKGLGSWDMEELKYIIEQEGLENMISNVDFDTLTIMDEWLGDDSTPRKKYIVSNRFNIAQA